MAGVQVRSPGVRQPADLRPATARSSAAAPEALPQAPTHRRPGAGRGASQNRWAPSRPERPRPPVWPLDPPGVLDRQGGGIPLPPAISRPLTDQMGASSPSNPPVACTRGWPGPVSSAALPGRRGMATASSIMTGWQAGAPPALGPPWGCVERTPVCRGRPFVKCAARRCLGAGCSQTARVMVGPGGRGGTCVRSRPREETAVDRALAAPTALRSRGGRLCWTHCLWPLRT